MVVVRGGIHPSAAVRYWGHLLPDTFTSHDSILLNQSILAVEGDKIEISKLKYDSCARAEEEK